MDPVSDATSMLEALEARTISSRELVAPPAHG